ncbi:MAG: DUF4115 domain-containing protein [Acidaminococcaceae bacterium]
MTSVGETLKTAREKKNLSLKQVATCTSIRQYYLEALENGQFKLVPGEVYVKGFISNYGNYLGLDGAQLVCQYKAEQATLAQAQANKEAAILATQAETKAKSGNKVPTTTHTKAQVEPKRPNFLQSKPLIIAGVAVVAVGLIAQLFSGGKAQIVSSEQTAEVQKAAQSTPTTKKMSVPNTSVTEKTPALGAGQEQVPIATDIAQDIDGAFVDKKARTVQVAVTATDACWVEAYADGKTLFKGHLQKGAQQSWNGDAELVLRIENLPNAQVTFNGKTVPHTSKDNVVIWYFRR